MHAILPALLRNLLQLAVVTAGMPTFRAALDLDVEGTFPIFAL